MNEKDFAVFILTNGRPDLVRTIPTLQKCGYTGKTFLVVDDLDPTRDKYIENFKDQVKIFDKVKSSKEFDVADNFGNMRAIVFARNACFQIAKELGIKYFVQLDDDYVNFDYRFNDKNEYLGKPIRNLDLVFDAVLGFFKSTNCKSIALSQNGDFIGGDESPLAMENTLKRKCMNSFFCSTDRPFNFIGTINEDVNTYVTLGSRGELFFTTNHVSLQQKSTQQTAGGMTEIYLNFGTYLKSFYTVMMHPSSVIVSMLNTDNPRLHHKIKWKNTVPCILDEKVKKI